MSRRRLGMLTAGVAVACATAAAAQTPLITTLASVHLTAASGLSGQAGTIEIDADCNPATGRPTISYSATGPAVGAYAGTYRESGTATIREPTSGFAVPVVAFHAEFTIDSPAGHVTGTKQLDLAAPEFGACQVDTSLGFPVGIHNFRANATYSAVIRTPEWTCTTSGSAFVDVAEQDAPGRANVDFHRFDQHFVTGSDPACSAVAAGPASKEQCKDGGWTEFEDPSFRNQGQCVAFANHHDGRGNDDEATSRARDETRPGRGRAGANR